jgi:hypothetical protein
MMERRVLVALLVASVASAGCFDFDLLRRAPDGMGGGGDLGGEADMAPGCRVPTMLPSSIFYVSPDGTGDGSSPAAASGTIQQAVSRALQSGQQSAILVVGGVYAEHITIDIGNILIYGSYDAQFACRDPSWPPTTQVLGPPGMPAFEVKGGTLLLDGLALKGGAGSSSADAFGIKADGTGSASPITLTVQGCAVQSHEPLSFAVVHAYAVYGKSADIKILSSHLISGTTATNATTSPGSWGIYYCGVHALIEDSTIETDNPGTSHVQYALDYDGNCGGATAMLDLKIHRSTLAALGGGGASNTACRQRSTSIVPEVQASALVAIGGIAYAAQQVESSTMTINFVASTLNGVGGIGIALQSPTFLNLGLRDTIITGETPISSYDSSVSKMPITAAGQNILHGGSTTVYKLSNSALDITAYRSMCGDANAKDLDPGIDPADHVHLVAGAAAADIAGPPPCSTSQDVDGEARPKGGACDVGADER